jgi:hypothetical protein
VLQGAPKKQQKKRRTYLRPACLFLRFPGLVLETKFVVFFGLLMQRNGQKRDKKIDGKIRQEKKNLNFFGQKFLTWTFPNFFLEWCF